MPPLALASAENHLLKHRQGLFKRKNMGKVTKFYSDAKKTHLYIYQTAMGPKKFTYISESLGDCIEKRREWKKKLEKEYAKKKYLNYKQRTI